MSFRQRAVIEFPVKEEISAAEIHQRLQRAYGSVCMGASSVGRMVKHFKDGKREAIHKAVRQCLRMAGTEFYRRGIFKLPECWEKRVQRSGDYVGGKKKLCRLRWCIWFVNNKTCYFTKNCCPWLSVRPSYFEGESVSTFIGIDRRGRLKVGRIYCTFCYKAVFSSVGHSITYLTVAEHQHTVAFMTVSLLWCSHRYKTVSC